MLKLRARCRLRRPRHTPEQSRLPACARSRFMWLHLPSTILLYFIKLLPEQNLFASSRALRYHFVDVGRIVHDGKDKNFAFIFHVIVWSWLAVVCRLSFTKRGAKWMRERSKKKLCVISQRLSVNHIVYARLGGVGSFYRAALAKQCTWRRRRWVSREHAEDLLSVEMK